MNTRFLIDSLLIKGTRKTVSLFSSVQISGIVDIFFPGVWALSKAVLNVKAVERIVYKILFKQFIINGGLRAACLICPGIDICPYLYSSFAKGFFWIEYSSFKSNAQGSLIFWSVPGKRDRHRKSVK